jgi:hypothetical protein
VGAQAENESGPLVLIHTTPRPVFFSLGPPPPQITTSASVGFELVAPSAWEPVPWRARCASSTFRVAAKGRRWTTRSLPILQGRAPPEPKQGPTSTRAAWRPLPLVVRT